MLSRGRGVANRSVINSCGATGSFPKHRSFPSRPSRWIDAISQALRAAPRRDFEMRSVSSSFELTVIFADVFLFLCFVKGR